ncbi:MAG TPA: hypothetical protein VF157_13555 [Chloroflexota bacterium]
MSRRLAYVLAAGLLLASCGGSQPATVHGTLLLADGRTWVVDRSLVVVPSSISLEVTPVAGSQVTVSGTWGAAGELVASSLQVQTPAPTPTVAPTLISPRSEPAPREKPRGKEKD